MIVMEFIIERVIEILRRSKKKLVLQQHVLMMLFDPVSILIYF
jgi:hypothetical protein